MMRTTLKDVAREAGVSHMTVSRVINNKQGILQETREKVLRAVEKLDYKPNNVARSLVNRKTRLIGVLVPDIDNPFFSCMVKSTERIASEWNYTVMLGDTGGEIGNEQEYMEIMLGNMVEGVILVTPRMLDTSICKYSCQIPLVLVDRSLEDGDILQIWADNRIGASRAADYLIELGHRRIGFISGPANVQDSIRREQGYRDALERHGIPFNSSLVVRGDFLLESGYGSLDHFLSLHPPPTAIFSSNDIMAFGLIKRARERGMAVPDDLSIVGFDNIPFSALIDPPLTTIDHPMLEMGRRAIQLLLSEIYSEEIDKRRIQLENTLVVRDSVVKFI